MPNKNTKINDDKTYHAQMQRLEKERLKLEKRLNQLYQREKSILSAKQNNALGDIRGKILETQRAIVENGMELRHMNIRFEKEKYRLKHCPVPSAKCPISPIRPSQSPATS